MTVSPFRIALLIAVVILASCASKKIEPVRCAVVNEADNKPLTEALSVSLTDGKDVIYSLETGGENLFARAWLCESAKKTLDIQYYIFARDNSGKIACDFLLRAAGRGVKIRIIIDDATVRANTNEIALLDSHDNIAIKVYNPGIKLGSLKLRLKRLFNKPGRLHWRMHNKTFIVDNTAAITGGRNIADMYFDYHKKYNYRDRDILVIGKTANDFTRSFEQFWNDSISFDFAEVNTYFRKKRFKEPDRFENLHRYACDTAHFAPRVRQKIADFPKDFRQRIKDGKARPVKQVTFITDLPGKNRGRNGREGGITTDSMLALLHSAKHTIDIESPYLIMRDQDMALFKSLTDRGVKIRVLTNSLAATDNMEAFSAYKRDRKEILKTGIEIHEFKPHPEIRFKVMSREMQEPRGYKTRLGLHAKTMIIDGETTVIGSYNLDPRSALYNTECMMVVRSKQFAKTVQEWIDADFLPENSWHTTETFNPDREVSIFKRMKLIPRRLIPKRYL